MQLTALPAFSDNYIWLIRDESGNAVVVDPGESAPVEKALQADKLRLRAILLTHHHPDHIGGVPALLARHDATVYAPHDPRIEPAHHRVADGDEVRLEAPDCRFRVIEVPGHTRSHIAYHGHGWLFCGDTLFSLGCGRLFEGTPAQMLGSLDRLSALPAETRVCCAHEYTRANAAFARSVEPDNPDLATRSAEIERLRDGGRPTVPSMLGEERACNPFLRVDAPAVAAWAARQGADSRVERFAALRASKDAFKA